MRSASRWSAVALVVACELGQGAEPFHGLQLAPPVTELTEQCEALLAVGCDGGEVTANVGLLCPGAQGCGPAPNVPVVLAGRQRLGHQCLAGRYLAPVGLREAQEPLGAGPLSEIIDVVEAGRWCRGIGRVTHQQPETVAPGGGPSRGGRGVPVIDGQGLFDPSSGFTQTPPQEQVPRRGVDQPQCQRRIISPAGGIERPPQVGGVVIQTLQPAALIATPQPGVGPLSERRVVEAVLFLHSCELAPLEEALDGVGGDRLEHAVAGAVGLVDHGDQRAVHEAGQPVDVVDGVEGPGLVDGQAPQQGAVRFGQQIPAPVDRRPQRLLAGRCAAVSGGQEAEPIVQPGGNLVHAESPHPRGGQLQGQGNPVEAPADAGDRRAVGVVQDESRCRRGGPFDEQLHRAGCVQWRHRPDPLPRQAERKLAGGQDVQPRGSPEQYVDQPGDGVDHRLAVVQHQQGVPGGQGSGQPVGDR
jgi:hypothetical protein